MPHSARAMFRPLSSEYAKGELHAQLHQWTCIPEHAESVFAAVDSVLLRGGAVYFHCRNGKDRSAIAVYAFLRITHGFSDAEVRDALSTRVSMRGTVLANVDRHQEAVRAWLQRVLEA